MLISTSYGVYGLVVRPGSVPFPVGIASLGEWLWVPAVGLFVVYLILLFPAVLRYRLYEIDIIINRTLVYGLLTAILGASTSGP